MKTIDFHQRFSFSRQNFTYPFGVCDAAALYGQRVVAFLRHATDAGTEAQRTAIQQAVTKAGAVLVDTLVQVGGPSYIHDETLAALLRRKQASDDFETLIITDLSRLSRSGLLHTQLIASNLREAGVGIATCRSLSRRE